MSDIVKQLKSIRLQQNLSQDAVCILGGFSNAQYLSMIERLARNPSITVLEKYAGALGYDLVLSPKEKKPIPAEGKMTVIEIIRTAGRLRNLDARYAYLMSQKRWFRKRSGDMAHLLREIERINFRRMRNEVRRLRKECAA
jgi:Helix-turn-helix.